MHSRARQHHGTSPGRKAIKRLNERLRREQRELARELQERVQRQSIPRPDDGPPPRID